MKYYTPTIEEFHIGFEYEISTREGAWLKDTYMCNSKVGVTFDDMPELAKISRVKLLDRSDIEDLGWEYVPYVSQGEQGDRWFDVHKKGKYTMISGGVKTNHVRIFIDSMLDDNLFQGTIKNKGKLKDVLKMIGIWDTTQN